MENELISARVPKEIKERYEKQQNVEGYSTLSAWIVHALNDYCEHAEAKGVLQPELKGDDNHD